MKGFYFIALILVIGIIFLNMVVAMGPESLTRYVDPVSFIILLLPPVVLLKSQFSWVEIGEAFTIGFGKMQAHTINLKKALLFFKALQKYLIWTSILGVMLGNIALFNVVSIGAEAIGRGMATALLILLYAIILVFTIALPFQFGLKKRIIEAGE